MSTLQIRKKKRDKEGILCCLPGKLAQVKENKKEKTELRFCLSLHKKE